ncbi:hypothetical protein FRC09_019563 [Ceratobasidium sp. 395]|nr:hypothetical protein FRC09_019563 [Ceratobasidium sp. 395]
MAMSKVSQNAYGTDMSPLKLFSGYLLSDVMLDIRFSTTFGYSLDPDESILTQYQALDLPKLVKEKKYPSYYESVLVVLEALAKSLDDEHFLFTHGLHALFFPHLSTSRTNKLHYNSMQTMTLNLRLLDRLLGLFFVSQRLPLALLSKDRSNQRDLTEFPKSATPYDRTGWMYDKFEEQDCHINSILDALQNKAHQDDTSTSSSTTPDKTSTGVKLEKLMAYHQRRSKAHAYDELAASMARAIWLHVEPEVGAADRLRQPIKMLQFISATSILAPFFRIFLEAPVTFAIKDIKLDEAIQVGVNTNVLHRPDLNCSTSALLQIEEVLWSGVFDLIQQCCQQVTSPILHWDLGHTHHQEWEPANVLQGWCWAKRQMITQPDTSQHSQDQEASSLPNVPLPSADVTVLTANPPSAGESGIPSELPEARMSRSNQKESGSSELLQKHDIQGTQLLKFKAKGSDLYTGVAKASQLSGADEGANKNKPGTAAKLKKRTLPEEEIKAPPAKKQKKKKRPGKKNKKEHQDTKAKRESSPPFKAAIPAKLTPKEEADYVKVKWTFNEDIEPMGELYEMPKVSQSFSTKLCIHRHQELASPEYIEFKHDIPKVPEQDQDFDFWQAVHDIAVSEQDALPASCYPTLHLTDEDAQNLSAEEFGHLFKNHSLVIEPPASSTPMQQSHFEDQDGNITLEKVMDPDTAVEVHDLAGSSVEEGQQQATSCTSTVGKVFNHIKSQHGHVVNLLSITDASGLFSEPSSVLKLDSDRFAFSSTQTLKETDKWTPKRSWLIVGSGGPVSPDHVDSAGKATYVKVEAGVGKLWLICLGRRDGADRITDSNPWPAE